MHLLDEDEFAEHAEQLGYPDEIRTQARASADWLVDAVTHRVPPFDRFDAVAELG